MSQANDQQGRRPPHGPDELFAAAGGLRGRSQKKFMEIHSYDTPQRPANMPHLSHGAAATWPAYEFAETGLNHATAGHLRLKRFDV
ncbi:hypothetical protein [Mycolicibacterium sphagni]|uniref:hypothetical protein n=1 Tax=Mycolicibacterium sphagni TaxID=1786 RepID=UPI00105643E7|nr:hypothetical protein [Mycolicibacterium sphagni]